MINIPKNNEVISASYTDPRRLLIYSFPKCGKTSAAMQIPNSILIDFEGGSDFYTGVKISIREEARAHNISLLRAIKDVADQLKRDPREYVILDTITELSDIARDYATLKYKQTLQGKGYTGTDVVSDLAMGAGYEYVRLAMAEMLGWFEGTYKKGLIMFTHIKLASIEKDGKEVQVNDIQLTGKLKHMICKEADAIGCMYRGGSKAPNSNYVDFINRIGDLNAGTRIEHLQDQVVELSTYDPITKKLSTNWNKIFKGLDETK